MRLCHNKLDVVGMTVLSHSDLFIVGGIGENHHLKQPTSTINHHLKHPPSTITYVTPVVKLGFWLPTSLCQKKGSKSLHTDFLTPLCNDKSWTLFSTSVCLSAHHTSFHLGKMFHRLSQTIIIDPLPLPFYNWKQLALFLKMSHWNDLRLENM